MPGHIVMWVHKEDTWSKEKHTGKRKRQYFRTMVDIGFKMWQNPRRKHAFQSSSAVLYDCKWHHFFRKNIALHHGPYLLKILSFFAHLMIGLRLEGHGLTLAVTHSNGDLWYWSLILIYTSMTIKHPETSRSRTYLDHIQSISHFFGRMNYWLYHPLAHCFPRLRSQAWKACDGEGGDLRLALTSVMFTQGEAWFPQKFRVIFLSFLVFSTILLRFSLEAN